MICRMCVIESINMKSIFKARSTKYQIADTIYQHFGFLPLPDDPISIEICTSCWTRIENFHGYYLNVKDAQKRFNKILLERTIKKDECSPIDKIKEECEIEPIEAVVIEEEAVGNRFDNLAEKNEENLTNLGDFLNVENKADVPGAEEEDRQSAAGDLDWLYSSCSTDDSESNNASETTHKASKAKKPTDAQSLKNKKPDASEKLRKRKSATTRSRSNRKDFDEEIAKQTTLKCDLCPTEFETFSLLQKHYDDTHQEKGYVVCCLKKFYTRSSFLDHLMRHVQPEQKCEVCEKMYVDKKSLRKHMQIYHGSVEEKTLQCDKCPNSYNKRFLLKQHMQSHEPKKFGNFPCKECGKTFKTNNSLQSHRRAIHENAYMFMCDICAKVFRSKIAFERHKRTHAGIPEPPLQCPQCQKWYKNLDRLKRHVRDHKIYDGKEHVCNICGKVSPSYIALRSHQKYLHFSQRTHKCTLCDSAFKEKLTLREHMATHTGDVLYTCSHCPKTSNSRANMYAHNKRMHPVEWELSKKTRELAASSYD